MRIPAAHDVRCLDPRAEADWCPCRSGIGLESAEAAGRVSGRPSTRGEIPLRILAVHDVWCMGVRAEVDWRPCRRRLDGLIATVGRCEERYLCNRARQVTLIADSSGAWLLMLGAAG